MGKYKMFSLFIFAVCAFILIFGTINYVSAAGCTSDDEKTTGCGYCPGGDKCKLGTECAAGTSLCPGDFKCPAGTDKGGTIGGTPCSPGEYCTPKKMCSSSLNKAPAGYQTGEIAADAPSKLVTTALNWFFAIAAILCVAVIVWAGITYATAGGDEEKVGKAKNRLIYGIIGVALIIGAYAITQLIKTAMTGSAPAAPTW